MNEVDQEVSDPLKELYAFEMSDADIKKLLKEIGHQITDEIGKQPTKTLATPVLPATREAFGLFRWIMASAAVIAILAGLWAGLNYVVTSAITSAITSAMVKPGEKSDQQGVMIAQQGVMIEDIKNNLNRLLDRIANETVNGPLKKLGLLNQNQFGRQLPQVAEIANEAKKSEIVGNIQTIGVVQTKLATLPSDTPGLASATESIINYASFVREKMGLIPNIADIPDIAEIRSKASCKNGEVLRVTGKNFTLDGGSQTNTCFELDGITIKNFTFINAIVISNGGAIRLDNVTFKNCLFIVTLPTQPARTAMQFARELLLKDIGKTPTFTISLG